MKNKKLKFIIAFLLAITFVIAPIPTDCVAEINTYENSSITEEEAISNLLSMGMEMEEINNFKEDDLLKLGRSLLISTDTKYYRSEIDRVENTILNKKGEVIDKEIVPLEDSGKMTEISKKQCEQELLKVKNSKEGYIVLSDNSKENGYVSNTSLSNASLTTLSCSLSPRTSAVNLANSVSVDFTTSDGYMRYALHLFLDSDTNDYLLYGYFQWLMMPDDRKIDVFAISNSTQLSRTNTTPQTWVQTSYESTYPGHDTWTVVSNPAPQSDIGGVGMTFDLDNDCGYWNITEVRGYILYYAKKNSSERYASAYSLYSHQDAFFGVSPGISIPWGGSISITPSSKMVSMLPNPYVQLQINK